jgi:hypothetical protein
MGVWKRNTKTLRAQLKLAKDDNVRDHLTIFGLMYEAIAEESSGVALKKENQLSFDQANGIVKSKAELVGKQADEMSRELGIDLVTNKPLIAE